MSDELLDRYVFGDASMVGDPSSAAGDRVVTSNVEVGSPPRAMPGSVPPHGSGSGSGGPRRALEVQPKDQFTNASGNLVVGKYENESTLCGGDIFGGGAGGVQGFEGFGGAMCEAGTT